jgi:hypothetical protein
MALVVAQAWEFIMRQPEGLLVVVVGRLSIMDHAVARAELAVFA